MEDELPVYTDPEAAAHSVHGGLVAPPAMLNAWTMPGLGRRSGRAEDPHARVYAALDAAGFDSVVATDSEHEYLRYLRLGERIAGVQSVEDISEAKQTALGVGHFVTTLTRYRTEEGEEVGRMRLRILKFRPGTGRAAAPSAAEVRPAPFDALPRPPRREATRRSGEVRPGEALPACTVEITRTLIVAGAIASRDYQDVHHDPDLARRRGAPDIFMNILTSCGLTARYVTDWAGPDVLLRSLRIRLGVPSYPGDRLRFEGEVSSVEGTRLDLRVAGTNVLGVHVRARIALDLPAGGRALLARVGAEPVAGSR